VSVSKISDPGIVPSELSFKPSLTGATCRIKESSTLTLGISVVRWRFAVEPQENDWNPTPHSVIVFVQALRESGVGGVTSTR